MSHRFLLFGVGVGGNYGCDAIVIGTERIIHHGFPDSEIWFPTRSWRKVDYAGIVAPSCKVLFKGNGLGDRVVHFARRVSEKMHISRRSLLPYPHGIGHRCDCILSIGGDLYTFAGKEKDWRFPYPIMEAGNEIMRRGKPYVVWCASVGPLEKAGDRLGEMVDHLRACRAIIVRESESFSYLREAIGLQENVYLAADPAFVMEPEPFAFPFLNKPRSDKLLAINFSLGPMEHVHGHLSVEQFQPQLVALVEKLLDDLSIKVLLVPHVRSDVSFLEPIHRDLAKVYPGRIQILPENIGARKTKWAVSQADALLTMRFHCALAGFSTQTPTMVMVSTSKGAKICKEMYGDSEFALNIRDMDSSTVIAKVRSLLDNGETLRVRLAPRCEEMKQRALGAGDILAKVL